MVALVTFLLTVGYSIELVLSQGKHFAYQEIDIAIQLQSFATEILIYLLISSS